METEMRESRLYRAVVMLAILMGLSGCGGSGESSSSEGEAVGKAVGTTSAPVEEGVKPKVMVPPGSPPEDLVVSDLREGAGREAKPGPFLTVQYVALRWSGRPFQSSWDNKRFQTFAFKLAGDPPQVNPGWEKGVPGMRVGGRRELIVPPKDLYTWGVPPEMLEPKDTLVYVVELLEVGM